VLTAAAAAAAAAAVVCRQLVQQYGCSNWGLIAEKLGTNRPPGVLVQAWVQHFKAQHLQQHLQQQQQRGPSRQLAAAAAAAARQQQVSAGAGLPEEGEVDRDDAAGMLDRLTGSAVRSNPPGVDRAGWSAAAAAAAAAAGGDVPLVKDPAAQMRLLKLVSMYGCQWALIGQQMGLPRRTVRAMEV
jgi:hypothetical protein